MARYKKYPFYVVRKSDGRVVSGWDYREDAVEAYRHPDEYGEGYQQPGYMHKDDVSVLTHDGVKRKYGQVKWASSRAKSNPIFLLPLLLPIAVGGVGLVAASAAAKTAIAPYINTPAVLGGSVGYLGASVAKQGVAVQVGAALVGYLGGLMIGRALAKAADAKAAEKIKTEEGVTTAEAEKILEWRKWCKDNYWKSLVTPQCYLYEA